MSLTAACGWTLCRAVLVALLVLPAAWGLRSRLDGMRPGQRTLLWTLLLTAFFTPALLTGYAYSKWSLALIRYPLWNEALYAALLTFRLIPVGGIILQFCPPPPLSPEGLHCARLAAERSGGPVRLRFLLPFAMRGEMRNALPVFCVVWLLAFQEFETASLMGTASWTVWLFDAQAGGIILGESLDRALLPMACQLLVIGLFAVFALQSRRLPSARRREPGRVSPLRDAAAWGVAVAAAAVATFIPLMLLGRDAVQGISGMLRSREMVREIGIAGAFGLVSGLAAAALAYGVRRGMDRVRGARATVGDDGLQVDRGAKTEMAPQPRPLSPHEAAWGGTLGSGERGEANGTRSLRNAGPGWIMACVGLAAMLPGLLGSLVVSLVVLRAFQWPVLNTLYDTPLPAVVALVWYLLPRAVLLQLLFGALSRQSNAHAAALLAHSASVHQRRAGGELVWRLRWRYQFLAAGILCVWGYLELTPVAILAPPGMTSAPVRLYNLMHYGRSYVVAAMTLVAMAVPPAVLVAAGGVRRVWAAVR